MKESTQLNLKEYNSYNISCIAHKALFPENIQDFQTLYSNGNSNKYFIIGGGYNVILAAKEYKNKVFIIISDNFSQIEVCKKTLTATSGTSLRALTEEAYNHGLSGLEIFYDIPGTVGGAVWMNAGAYGESFMEKVEEVTYLDTAKKAIKTLPIEKIDWGYRHTQFQDNNSVILSATFNLTPKEQNVIKEKMDKYYNIRTSRFPKELPNAGSVFKRPPDGLTVGEMVELLGLKGHSIGGAKISEKHGGFIVNYNNATADDILGLINLVKEKVYEKYNIQLHLEQIVVEDTITTT